MFIPEDLLTKLEFDKICALLADRCKGEQAKSDARNLQPETTYALIVEQLKRVDELRQAFELDDPFPMFPYEDISEPLRMLNIEGYVLSVEELLIVAGNLRLAEEIFAWFSGERPQQYPQLAALLEGVVWEEELPALINRVLDEEGKVRPDASTDLQRIRKAMLSRKRALDRLFAQLIEKYRQKGWLTENAESIRNGRRVLSVPAEYKRKIRGIIHDESATGKTVFIEPEEIISLNNDLFDLQAEEKREIYRIFKALSAELAAYTSHLARYNNLLVVFDLLCAKASLALEMRAAMPRLSPEPRLGIQMGYHPLLLLKNKSQGRITVPFDLQLFGQNRILVLSGPNAGGKSVTMKAVGLLQLMLQAGMLVPADEISEMGVFQKFFADIGDQQSLEDDLSTYSSRLQNMRRFLEAADEHSLVLIDEFGSGTDPKIGGAIAEAILRAFHRKKVFAVVTTHYSNLKVFAFNTKGIVNGSMLFDKEKLAPTYRLKVGRPGSSYAFEIAKKSGLPEGILKYARKRTGHNERALDEILIDLQRERAELEEKLKDLARRERQLQRLIANYEDLLRDVQEDRERLRLQKQQRELEQTAEQDRALQETIRELKKKKKLEEARAAAAALKKKRENLRKEVARTRKKLLQKAQKELEQRPIAIGDEVALSEGDATGIVEAIDPEKGKLMLRVGILRMEVPLEEVVLVKPAQQQKSASFSAPMVKKVAKVELPPELDVRGLSANEALAQLETYLDRALLDDLSRFRIIHGKGQGILRKTIAGWLRRQTQIADYFQPDGNSGITEVIL